MEMMEYRIREWRRAHGMKQEELAKRAGLSIPTISAAEVGKRLSRPSTLQAIAEVFGLRDSSDLAEMPPQQLPISETLSEDLARASRLIGALAEIAANDYRQIQLVMRDLRRMREQSRMR
ncbi:helix-turn-helix transcriptional regulator [Agrobacterium vitis]|uniref:helix-turn-helix transcriptional regulator n=1 Tax=Allorhizobium ampelinum TaxID=3025782 RepID=UPI001F3AE6FA|nr:helix-turn-helix domain-containing protein [Allorhizobium ampelinum]MCF1449953.1 helix-turn-helix transcriptional regulator [Allorhizobium ampelinum]